MISPINTITPSEQTGLRAGDGTLPIVSDVKPLPKGNDEKPSSEQVKEAAEKLSEAVKESNLDLAIQFSVDSDTRKTVVKVVNSSTGELVRQIPSQEVLAIARSIDKFNQGLLLNKKA